MTRRLSLAIFVAAWACSSLTPSQAAWLSSAAGLGLTRSSAVEAGSTPAAVVSGRTVTLSWTAAALTSGGSASGYVVRRYDAASTTERSIDSGTCAVSVVTATTCTHTAAPSGSWRYTVTPAYGLWRGAESPFRSVTVASPSLVLASSSVKPGTTMTGTAAGFIGGETLRFRLDAATGTDLTGTLAGSATPAVVAGSGTGSVTVTIPAGTSDGAHTVYAVASPSNEAATFGIVVDGTPPPVPVLTRTPPATSGDSATFEYTEAESSASVECRLDAAPFARCTSPVDYVLLAVGSHTFQARATDTLGNVSASASYTWTVDTSLPNIAISFPAVGSRYNDTGFATGCGTTAIGDVCGTADDVVSVSAVAVSLRRVSTGLYWTGSAFSAATETWLAATGTSDWSYPIDATSFTTEGDYTLRGRATNGSGGVGYDTRTFTIDRTAPPTPTFTSVPPATSGPWVSVAFTTTDATATFQCRLDAAAFASCSSPQAYGALSDGAHTIAVRAVDGAGNTSATASTSWTADATAPTVGASFPTATGYNASGWQAGCGTPVTGDICGTAGDSGSGLASVAVSIRRTSSNLYWDGSSFAAASQTFLAATGTASWTYAFAAASFPADGVYTVRWKATDAVGNATTAGLDVTIDTTAPPAPVITRTPTDPSGASVSFDFTAAETGTTTKCTLDAGTWSSCTTSAAYGGLAAGSHTFSVRATDAAGNTSTSASYTWTVDLSLPTVLIAFPATGGTYNDAGFDAGCATAGGDICGTASAPTGSLAGVDVSIRRSGTSLYWNGTGFASAIEVFRPASGTTSWSYAFPASTFPADDIYMMRARATNAVGLTAYDSLTVVVDRTAPAAPVITSGPTGTTTGGDSFTFTGESGATFQCRLDAGTWSTCVSPLTPGALADGTHTFDVKSVDLAGNVGTATSRTWTIDATAPSVGITFPVDGTRYAGTGYDAGCGTVATGDICGTSSDGGSGVSLVEISVQRQSTGLYLSGGSFGSSGQSWVAASGTASWTYALTAATFPADDTYTILARATDGAGNAATATTSFLVDRTAPAASGVSGTNGGATVRKLEAGDTLRLTYSEAIAPASVIAGWNGATSQNVVVRATNSGSLDKLTVYNSTNSTLLPLGTIGLRGNFVSFAVTFGVTGTASTLTMSGTVLTITLGTVSDATKTTIAAAAANMTWTPAAGVTDIAGNAASTTLYRETDLDSDF